MILIELQSAQYFFYWKEEAQSLPVPEVLWENAEVGFGSPQQAIQFVRRFAALVEFRTLLGQAFPGQTYRWKIDEIHKKLADLLVQRRLRVWKRWRRATGPSVAVAEAAKVQRREVVERSEPSEPPTFLGNHDGPSQAEALANAASGGDPFCEECEKARQQMQQSSSSSAAEEEEEEEAKSASFPPNHDGNSQAKSLIDASAEGVPFCEECEKARQQAAA